MRKFMNRSLKLLLAVYLGYRFLLWKRVQDATWKMGLPVSLSNYYVPMFGNFFQIIFNFNRIYDLKLEIFQKMDTLTYTVPPLVWRPVPVISTADPMIIKHILKDKFDVWIKPDDLMEALHPLLGNGIFAINHGPYAEDQGASWTLQRKTASKVFTNNNFKTLLYNTFAEHAHALAKVMDEKIQAKENPIDVQNLMFRYTLDSIGKIGFGVEINSISSKDTPFAYAFDRAQYLSFVRFVNVGWNTPFGLLYASERELRKHTKTLNKFVIGIVNQRKEEMARGEGNNGDILTLFLQEKLGLSDMELRDVVMSFCIAGRDTTACNLSFAFMLLATNPEWQRKLREEVKEKLGDRENRILDSGEISQMKLLQNIILETLRLYPSVPIDVKVAATDDILPGGIKVEKGTRISFEPFVMGRLEHFWGKDAAKFNPDRWLSLPNLPTPYEFPQFQAGPRICLGESMAKFEASLLVAFLVDRYEFSLVSPTDTFTYQPGVTLTIKDGLPLIVKRI